MLRTTYASLDSVHIEITRNGAPAGGLRFAVHELAALEAAVTSALTPHEPTTVRHVGTVSLPSGAVIEIGCAYGAVVCCMQTPVGVRGRVTTIKGAELLGLQRAIADLKQFRRKVS